MVCILKIVVVPTSAGETKIIRQLIFPGSVASPKCRASALQASRQFGDGTLDPLAKRLTQGLRKLLLPEGFRQHGKGSRRLLQSGGAIAFIIGGA
jgi:hypothetical protein